MHKFHLKKDYYGGALMVLIGLSAVYASVQYNLGTLSHMGPGFFPCAVGVLLAVVGLLIAASAGDENAAPSGVIGHAHGVPDLRGCACIIAAILAFIALGTYFGLLPATFAIVFISALGDRDNTVKQALILAVAMMVVATGIFWYALQLQMPLITWGG